MQEKLIDATEKAIKAVGATRFFQTERGFHGRFYCALYCELERAHLTSNGAILEMEYQKSSRHSLNQRPDIILHVPAEHELADVTANNVAVWALKRHATAKSASEDFSKLDQMFDTLRYCFGFFINIDSIHPMCNYYNGAYRSRLFTAAASLSGTGVKVIWGRTG
jgi:hypothetical protein